MNFLNFLTAGASRKYPLILVFNFNLQNLASSSALQQTLPTEKLVEPTVPLSAEMTVKMKQEMEVLSQQQQLINQYMHLNIQLLSQKL
jgi:hypothetical protein